MAAIEVSGLSHVYGRRQALCDLSFDIAEGEIFTLLGPNGGGKTTLFRILSTLIPAQSGSVRILGQPLATNAHAIRERIGVVFQAPSLDKKLTVSENIRYQAALYGLGRREVVERERDLLARLGLSDRRSEVAEKLSGGLRRRVELAKGMIHLPRLLLLDEPSTGLDPGARSDLWKYLRQLRDGQGMTIVLTTHLLEEAENADCIGIIDEGRLVAFDTPDALKSMLGGDTITISCGDPQSLAARISERFEVTAGIVDHRIRLELSDGHRWVGRLVESFPDEIDTITLGKPSLEDVFISQTGHTFWESPP